MTQRQIACFYVVAAVVIGLCIALGLSQSPAFMMAGLGATFYTLLKIKGDLVRLKELELKKKML
jgi:hypothetical protein